MIEGARVVGGSIHVMAAVGWELMGDGRYGMVCCTLYAVQRNDGPLCGGGHGSCGRVPRGQCPLCSPADRTSRRVERVERDGAGRVVTFRGNHPGSGQHARF